MGKSRKGAAMIMALFITLLASSLIAATLTLVDRFNRSTLQQTVIFVDHTTVMGFAQAEKARIVQTNLNNGRAMHARPLTYHQDGWRTPAQLNRPPLVLNELIIPFPDHTVSADNTNRHRRIAVSDGVGLQTVFITVFDMFFDPDWIDVDALRADPRGFPPVLDISAESIWDEIVMENAPDEEIRGRMHPDLYGSYLVRVELFNGDYNQRPERRPDRMIEEAFVQILELP